MQLEKEQQAVAAAAVVVQHSYDDFGPIVAPSFTPQRSFSTGAVYQHPQYSPPPVPPLPITQAFNPPTSPPVAPATPNPSEKASPSNELDLNDPSTLEIYSRILLFKDDRMRDELAFSRTLTPKQRRVVHLIAQKLGVYHYSVGEGEDRYAVVTRIDPNRACFLRLYLRLRSVTYVICIAESPASNFIARPFRVPFGFLFPVSASKHPTHEKINARHEDPAYPSATSHHTCVQWEYSRGLCHHCFSISPLSRGFWVLIR